jgi:spermidine/putrescine transport system permease protein
MANYPLASKAFSVRKLPGFTFTALTCFLMLYAPIMVLVGYSFNSGSSLALWEGFSLRWYASAWQNDKVQDATILSLIIAVQAAFYATVLATMAALGTTRTRPYKGQTAIYTMINQPIMVPEIVTAVALLICFAAIKQLTGYQGLGYLIIAHTGMDRSLEIAAADLYATPWRCFYRVTLPLMWPGILAGSMLAFVISLDDVVITEFVKSAGQDTLPTYMLGQLRRVITPEMNAISSLLLLVSILMVSLIFLLNRKKA